MLDPATTVFRAAEGKRRSCKGCLWQEARSTVCHQVEAEAQRRGIQSCEYPNADGKSVIFVLVEVDARQQDLFTGEIYE